LQDNGCIEFLWQSDAGPADRSPANRFKLTRPGGSPGLNAAFAPDCSRSVDDDGAIEFHSIKSSNELALSTQIGPCQTIGWLTLNQ
jgi:hypothetical protein